jgi:hypothetical protein
MFCRHPPGPSINDMEYSVVDPAAGSISFDIRLQDSGSFHVQCLHALNREKRGISRGGLQGWLCQHHVFLCAAIIPRFVVCGMAHKNDFSHSCQKQVGSPHLPSLRPGSVERQYHMRSADPPKPAERAERACVRMCSPLGGEYSAACSSQMGMSSQASPVVGERMPIVAD